MVSLTREATETCASADLTFASLESHRCRGLVEVGLSGRARVDAVLAAGVVLTLRQGGAAPASIALGPGTGSPGRARGRLEIDGGCRLLRQRGIEIGLGLVAGDDVVARIDLQQQIARVDEYVVVDAVFDDVSGDLGSDRYGISFGIGVIGTYLIPRHQPVDEAADDGDARRRQSG